MTALARLAVVLAVLAVAYLVSVVVACVVVAVRADEADERERERRMGPFLSVTSDAPVTAPDSAYPSPSHAKALLRGLR